MASNLTAKEFTIRLAALQSDEELRKHPNEVRFDPDNQPKGDRRIAVKMGDIFKLGKEFSEKPVIEIEKLMESPIHKVRVVL